MENNRSNVGPGPDAGPGPDTDLDLGGGPTDTSFPIYLIIPSAPSRILTVVIVLLIYIIYLGLIGFMSSYHTKFVPNYAMLWDFVWGGNSQKYQDDFNRYVQGAVMYAAAHLDQDGSTAAAGGGGAWQGGKWVPSGEGFAPTMDDHLAGPAGTEGPAGSEGPVGSDGPVKEGTSAWTGAARSAWDTTTRIVNQAMVPTFVQGNKVKVSRRR